jgi:hypothetical protein
MAVRVFNAAFNSGFVSDPSRNIILLRLIPDNEVAINNVKVPLMQPMVFSRHSFVSIVPKQNKAISLHHRNHVVNNC